VLGRLAARRAGVPVIVHTIHGPSFGSFQGALANALFRAAERYAGRVTTHFVVVARAMTEQYLAAGIGRRAQYTASSALCSATVFVRARSSGAARTVGHRPGDFVVGKIARCPGSKATTICLPSRRNW